MSGRLSDDDFPIAVLDRVTEIRKLLANCPTVLSAEVELAALSMIVAQLSAEVGMTTEQLLAGIEVLCTEAWDERRVRRIEIRIEAEVHNRKGAS